MSKQEKKEKFTDEEQKLLFILGNRIKDKRVKLKLSQSDLSEKTGIDRSYISLLESGIANITFLKLKKIEEVLGDVF